MPADSSTVATTAEQLGDAPPCRSYKSLIVLADFSELANDIWKCETKEEFAGVATRPFKSALAELVSMSNAAQKRLQQAIEKALEAMKAQALGQIVPIKRKRQSQHPSLSPSQKQKLLSCDVREQFAVGMKQIRGNIAEPAENHATVDWSVPNVLIAIPETRILKAQPIQVTSTNDILDALDYKRRNDLNIIAKKTSDLLSAT